MSTRRTSTTYESMVVIFLTVVIFGGLGQYGFASGLVPIPPGMWSLAPLALLWPIVLNRNAERNRISALGVWAYIYLLVASLWTIGSVDNSHARESLIFAILFVVVLATSIFLLESPSALCTAIYSMIWVTMGASLINVYEFFNPGIFSSVSGRAAGFHINPNSSGTALVMGMILTYRAVPSKYRLAYASLIGAGVLATFSRGSLACWALGLVLLQLTDLSAKNLLRSALIFLLFMAALYVSPAWTAVENQIAAEDIYTDGLVQRIRLSEYESIASDVRVDLAKESWEMFKDRPLLGHGIGTPLIEAQGITQGPHNMLLTLLIQFGILGGLILLSLVLLFFRSGVRNANTIHIVFGSFLIFNSLFTHNMLDQAHFAFAFAVAWCISGTGPSQSRTKTPVYPSWHTASSNTLASLP